MSGFREYLQSYKTNYKVIISYGLVIVLFGILTFFFHLFTRNYFFLISGLTVVIILLYSFIRGYSFQVFTFLFTLLSGYYGFLLYDYRQDYPPINALYSTIRLFVLDTDQVFSEDGLKYVTYPLPIEMARWAAVVYIISTILKLFMNYFGHSIRKIRYTVFGNHIVIFGLDTKSYILANSLLHKHKLLLIIDEPDSHSEELKEKGAVIVQGNLLEESTYRKSGIAKSKQLIAFNNNDAVNLNIIQSVHQFLKNRGNGKKVIPFYIQQNHTLTQTLYDSIEKIVSSTQGTNLELHSVSLHSLIARQLLDNHPIYKGYEHSAKDSLGDPFHLLFIGFGHTGQQIAIQAIQRAHFTNKHPLNITVVDREAKKVERQWRESIPRLNDCVKIDFIEQDIEIHDIGTFIKEHNTRITHIYICLDQDEQDTLQGIRLFQQISDIPIFIKLQGHQHFANWLHEEVTFPNIYRFGAWEDVLTEEMFINEELDKMAKKVHEIYIKNINPEGDPWEKLTFFAKNSNRAQVDHLETKLFLIGLSLSDTYQQGVMDEVEYLEKLPPSVLEELAIIEHQRWNVFHFMNGWDTLPIEKVSKGHDRVNIKKLHACLVPWGELPQVGQITGRKYQEDDSETIKGIHKLVTENSKYIIE